MAMLNNQMVVFFSQQKQFHPSTSRVPHPRQHRGTHRGHQRLTGAVQDHLQRGLAAPGARNHGSSYQLDN